MRFLNFDINIVKDTQYLEKAPTIVPSIVHSLQFAVLSFSSSTIQIFFMKIIKSLSKAAAADIVLSSNQYEVDHRKWNLNVIFTLSHF